MLWTISAPAVDVHRFSCSDIHETLYEFDGPRIFITRSDSTELYLWYQSDEDHAKELIRYLVVPVVASQVALLKSGDRSVHDVLKQSWLWAVDVNYDFDVVEAYSLGGLEEVPAGFKPSTFATLYPQHMPLLSYRLIGRDIREGNIPASVVSKAADGPTSALKRLLESITSKAGHGRPEESLRKAYDIPAKRFAFNSFEVAFAEPVSAQQGLDGFESVYEECARQLMLAFDWLENPNIYDTPDAPVLEALKDLAPPSHGAVEQAEVGGTLIRGRARFNLTREHRRAVARALKDKKVAADILVKASGEIRELDKDKFSFILRNRPGGDEDLRCEFKEEHYDDVVEYFMNESVVEIAGRLKPDKVLAIS
ncbi:hypothetical protein, partial [Metapseudomonas otitidis]|uniref:hypothetical protein n=1 Tax=Metapseudomonas otitidis TaxID=319939 RepID=UPI0028118CFD